MVNPMSTGDDRAPWITPRLDVLPLSKTATASTAVNNQDGPGSYS